MSLRSYTAKRDFKKTSEPKGKLGAKKTRHLRFVIQKHAASRLHFDLRLELGGALKSWAVPKGLPYARGEKHLAVQVEDHPIDYQHFEGTIPQGEYGGGTIMVWDQGTYEPVSTSPEEELAGGKLHFILHGKKLQGEWYLVRIKKGDQWLVIKGGEDFPPVTKKADDTSALSGKNMQALSSGDNLLPKFVAPMLAKLAAAPPSGDWAYEIKFDGWRAIVLVGGGTTQLLSRNENDLTAKFPEIVAALNKLPVRDAIFDGEIVALEPDGKSSFQRLQAYDTGEDRPPIYLYLFDLLQLNGKDLRSEPLEKRKEELANILHESTGNIRYSASLGSDAPVLLEKARKLQLEGLIGKKSGSSYQTGRRTGDWIKLKLVVEQEFVIGGYTEPAGSRKYVGALIIGFQHNGQLTYAGKVGTGFSDKALQDLHHKLTLLNAPQCPFANLPEKRAGKWGQSITAREMQECHWVKPVLVCQIKFTEWTRDAHLRHPVFLGLRKDKSASKVIRENTTSA